MTTSASQPMHIENLGMRYVPGQWALQDVTVSVDPGSVLAVLGPSGSGKSTLLNLVAGLQTPHTGEIRVGEKVLSTPTLQVRPERRDIAMVFQDYALWPHMNVSEIIGYGLRYGAKRAPKSHRQQRVQELVDLLQLKGLEQRRPAELSGGQQQRVSIARALATRPALLLFDEPLSNLDTQLRQEMRDELGALFSKLDTTVMYVTHDFSEALALADKILILEHGQTMQIATPHQVFTQPANPWAANLAGYTVRLRPERVRHVGGQLEIQLAGAWLPATAAGTGWDTSQERGYEVAIDPEGIRITPGGTLAGVIQTSSYEGRRWRHRIAIPRVGILGTFGEHKMLPGMPVRCGIDPTAALVFSPTRTVSTVRSASLAPQRTAHV